MKSQILEQAQHIIDEKKYQNERIALDNKIKALENSEFKTLYNQYMDLMISEAKQGLNESEKTKQLKKQLDASLKKLNLYPIMPIYSCPKCSDTGRVNGVYCDCLKKELNKLIIQESGFGQLADFDKTDLKIFENNEDMQKLYKKMQEWCKSNFNKDLIVLGGETGVGKTYLMKCMANELVKRNFVITLTTSFAMNQDFLKSYSCKNIETQNSILDKYLNAEILFIDDLGTELRQPGITVNYLYLLINERKTNKKPTIITTNLTLEEINDYYDERIFSRIADKNTSVFVYISGQDLRFKK